ncbi:hypothetical protein OAQ99_02990 [Candidatus Kapabacteria bacterium]|nr:hypothetical protein [Candidatus Kapabacteria bacterium]
MQKIDTLSGLEGRRFLHKLFRELRYKRQISNIKILYYTLLICVRGEDSNSYSSIDVEIQHKIGFGKGLSIWMEEIVNRFFFSSILSLVYFGAASLILIIGLNRFTDSIGLELVIGSVAFETSMLLIMFVTMAFSPNDDSYYDESESDNQSDELIVEIGEIGRDLAATVVQIENLSKYFIKIAENQEKLIDRLDQITGQNENLIRPNNDMLSEMKEVNIGLSDFNSKIKSLSNTVDQLTNNQIKEAVKEELENIISKKIK